MTRPPTPLHPPPPAPTCSQLGRGRTARLTPGLQDGPARVPEPPRDPGEDLVAALQAELARRPAAALEAALEANDMVLLRAAAAALWARRRRRERAYGAAGRAVEDAAAAVAERAAAALAAAAALEAQCVAEIARLEMEAGEANHRCVAGS
jgi:hypothetical protein